jgi:hypothetical protein
MLAAKFLWPLPDALGPPWRRMEGSTDTSFLPVRAPRYSVAMPLQYRRVGEQQWHTGVVENISQSGIFFRGDRALSEAEVVEINFTLRSLPAVESSTPRPCTAIIVRTDRSRVENKPAFGTRFLD